MAGHTIVLYFQEQGYDVTAFTTKPFYLCKNITGNALDFEQLGVVLRAGHYDVIVNCIGILNQFAENNPIGAKRLNTDLPHFIADSTKSLPCKLIHMSTDCVFAGNTGPYRENSVKDGQSVYDMTKAEGEVIDDKNLTFRNSIIGPDLKKEGIGLFNWFMKQSGPIQGYSSAIWTGVTTLTLAKAMEAAISQNLSGLYNLVNNESISKYDLLNLFKDAFDRQDIDVLKSDKRHLDKTLVSTRDDFSFIVPSYSIMINEMKEWIDAHNYLYPHYF